ncbi:MAG TPA: PilX N-terminal domain-containing pilus assembly protein [Desulfomonilia bacterium]
MKEKIRPLENEDGMVLVMVLLVLMVTVVVGILLARTSFIETRIAGNEAQYKKTLYKIESAAEWAMLKNSAAFADLGTTINGVYTYDASSLPSEINDVTISVRLTAISKPPLSSGTDPARFKARYYRISASKNGQSVLIGAYKAFPKT